MPLKQHLAVVGEQTPDIYHDVVIRDDYRLGSLEDQGTISFLDLGASRGLYSLAARLHFPKATIWAVEPNPQNFKTLVQNTAAFGVHCLNAAIGTRTQALFEREGPNSSVHVYQTLNRWKTPEVFKAEGFVPSKIPVITLTEAFARLPAGKTIIKIDIESGEWNLVDDPVAEATLRRATQVHMEMHYSCHERSGVTREQFLAWAGKFATSHNIDVVPLSEYGALLHLKAHGS